MLYKTFQTALVKEINFQKIQIFKSAIVFKIWEKYLSSRINGFSSYLISNISQEKEKPFYNVLTIKMDLNDIKFQMA